MLVTTAAAAEAVAVASQATESPSEVRAALFAAAPLILAEYQPAAAVMAVDWFEELREAARPPHRFTPAAVPLVDDEVIAARIARATNPLHEIEQRLADDFEAAFAESLAAVNSEIQQIIADGFRETVIENSKSDPDSVGWRRYARPGACAFCRMLADRGAVYSRTTARFAAHGAEMRGGRKGGDCMCLAGPSWDPDAPRASAMQYVASDANRTKKQRAGLRAYLKKHYGDGGSVGSGSSDSPAGFAALTREQLELQLRITEGLKDSAWRTKQIARLRARLAEIG